MAPASPFTRPTYLTCASNFGIVKHPGTGSAASSTLQIPHPQGRHDSDGSIYHEQSEGHILRSRRVSSARNDASTAEERLKAKGFIIIQWYGKCDADKVTIGTYDVQRGCGGMYGLVFDNTFSKTVSKTATFVLLTYPTNAPPNATNMERPPGAMAQALNAAGRVVRPGLNVGGNASESVDSLHSQAQSASSSRGTSSAGKQAELPIPTFHVGILHKRRRKRGQGWARRYFSLDFMSCTLSYYHNRNSSALRGAIPLSLAAIAADERRREISVDSGAEIWHLKCSNAKDFQEWTAALEAASNKARGNIVTAGSPKKPGESARLHTRTNSMYQRPEGRAPSEDDQEWDQVEGLVSRIVGTRDAVRRLVDNTKPRPKSSYQNSAMNSGVVSTATPHPVMEEGGDYFAGTPTQEKRPFWKRKPSNTPSTSSSGSTVRKPGSRVVSMSATAQLGSSMSTQMAPAPPSTARHTNNHATHSSNAGVTGSTDPSPPDKSHGHSTYPDMITEDESSHKHCTALLTDLDVVLADFNNLLVRSKKRRFPPTKPHLPPSLAPRMSMDSTATDEFFDAAEDVNDSQLFVMHSNRNGDDGTPSGDEDDDKLDSGEESDNDAVSLSSDISDTVPTRASPPFFPPKPKNLAPLPITQAPNRRTTIKPATVAPPSLISFLRKNVGKDLSTISMPVSANEPTSALQRLGESMEYAHLLDAAAQNPQPHMRHLLITAFAVSYFSANRSKERAVRKPFNPMLGETFEMVRAVPEEPGNFRFIAEKVCHRPVKLACQADSPLWSYTHSLAPTQKFWGKSAELITEGKVHVVLRLKEGDECYSWPIATVFLRNVVMGEKYVEPVGNVHVLNETTGAPCNVEFKSKGMWGGRSEDVEATLQTFGGAPTSHGLVGTWTNELKLTEGGKAKETLWKVGNLVEGEDKRYGMSTFAAGLNEITSIEERKCAITDSRLRADQRLAEDGKLDEAEITKAKLEEAQRERRRQMEAEGREWTPRWFELDANAPAVDGDVGGEGERKGEECWKLKTGMRGYWEEREGGKWFGVEDVLLVKSGAHA